MGLTQSFNEPLFTGSSRSSEVPGRFDVSLNGRPYMIDLGSETPDFRRQSIPLLRNQADTSASFGESSLNPEELIRRGQNTWDHGAGQCLTPETRVLTADLQWTPVGELEVGQRLVAFEEEASARSARQWRESVVTATGRIMKDCYRILLSDGTKFVASYDHKWLKVVKETASWAESRHIQPASKAPTRATKLLKVMEPWDFDASRGAGYLAAALDGEGCLTQTVRPPRKDRLMLSFAQRDNGMLASVKQELDKRGYKYSEATSGGTHKDVHHLNILGGTPELLRFLGSIRPERLLPKFQPLNNGVMRGTPVEVVECEFIGEQEVVALTTSTETFIAEGYATHNTYFDREDSDPARFRASKGVDVWTRWNLSLLPATRLVRASVNTNLQIESVGPLLYLNDGSSLLWTNTVEGAPSWTTVTGLPSTPMSLATDGFSVWTAHGSAGLWVTGRGDTTSQLQSNVNAGIVGYVKGRLMVASGPRIYNITATNITDPEPLYTHPNLDFQWVGFAQGPAAIYAAGFSGDRSLVYRTSIKQDGTALDAPIIAGELPDGEIITSVGSYVSFVLLGTNRGVRFCATNGDGSLVVGSLIKTPAAVYGFEGQDQYVWFGWSNYDGTSTGLGRLDLSTFTAPLTPAYASDLMATAQGAVTDVVTYDDRRVFTVSGVGVFVQDDVLVEEGSLDVGLISYGISDEKVAVFLDMRVKNASGSNAGSLAIDEGPFVSVGVRSGQDTKQPFPVGEQTGEVFEPRVILRRDSDPTVGPVLTRVTLRGYPKPARGEIFTVPLKLHESVVTRGDDTVRMDPGEELELLLALQRSRQLVSYQLGDSIHSVVLDDSVFAYSHRTSDGRSWNGTLTLKLKAFTS